MPQLLWLDSGHIQETHLVAFFSTDMAIWQNVAISDAINPEMYNMLMPNAKYQMPNAKPRDVQMPNAKYNAKYQIQQKNIKNSKYTILIWDGILGMFVC